MIAFFVRHPTAANLLMLVIVLLGILGIRSLRREVLPEYASEYINIQVVYRDASAEEIEESICQRIEQEIEGIEGVGQIRSIAREGIALVTVEVADGYRPGDVLEDVENAVDQIDNFPQKAETPAIWEFDRTDNVCTVTLWAEKIAEKELHALAGNIKRELLTLDDVSLIDLGGFPEHQIRVEARDAVLRAHGLTIDDLAREIRAQSTDLPAGSVRTQQREIKIRVVDQRRRAEDFRDLPVYGSAGGARIPLRTFATVSDTFEVDWIRSEFNGCRSVNLYVTKARHEDTIRVADAVRGYVAERAKSLPDGVHLTVWGDWSLVIRDRLGMLVKNGLWGFVLVALTLWWLLSWRVSFWVAAGIPVSFLGTLWLMDCVGLTINMITTFSLVLALGIIVDDAIVIGENIFAHWSRGKPPAQAAIDGTKEVALGVLASVLTTVAIFLPLVLMKGEIGKVLRVMPYGVIAALVVSLVEAFLVLPYHLSRSMRKAAAQPPRVRAAIDRAVARFTRGIYGPVLQWATSHPAVPLATMVMLLLVAMGLLAGGRLKFQPLPELDGDVLYARIELPRGTTLAQTRQVVRQIEDAVAEVDEHFSPQQPNGQRLIRNVSTAFGRVGSIGQRPGLPETGSHTALMLVELLEEDRRTVTCEQVLRKWRDTVGDVADVVRLTFDQVQVTPGGKAVNIELQGNDLAALKRASLQLQEKIRSYPGVRNLTDDLSPGKEEIRVRLKPDATARGVSSIELAQQLGNAFWGSIAEEFQRGSDNVEVRVRLADDDRRSVADLDDFRVRSRTGAMIPLHEVAGVKSIRGFAQIVRVDGRETVAVTADLETSRANAAEIVADLETRFLPGFLQRHEGVSVNLEGQRKETEETTESVYLGFAIGLAMIFLLLSFVFQSYVEPLIVMAAIPFGLVGAVFGHLLLGLDWTMPSTVGFVSLAGIVVNDSIILVGFIKSRLREGKDVGEAVYSAGMARFRPVFLTSATTVAGLLPIIIETSLQAQFLVPMAVAISFGLMFATVVVLLLVPSLYTILARAGLGQSVAPES